LLRRTSSDEAEPLSHARVVFRRPREEVVLTGFAAETQSAMMMGDKTELSATVCATVRHEAAPSVEMISRLLSASRHLTPTGVRGGDACAAV
jgi:hypothetical protein